MNPKDDVIRRRKKLAAGGVQDDAEEEEEEYNSCRLTPWPPARWAWQELTPRTGRRWEEKVFVRDGEAAGTLGDLMLRGDSYIFHPPWRYAAYWQGALYIQCRGEYISR